MEHGAAYRQRQNQRVDDSLANSRRSEYRPFRYGINHQTPVSPPASAWSISPVALQQSLPPMVPAEGASDSTDTLPGSTIFESQIAANRPYLENFAWENATEFRPTAVEEPREDAPVASPLSTNGVALEELSTRKYFRDPRFNPEPWMPGFWPRVPWLGLGALLATTACAFASLTVYADPY